MDALASRLATQASAPLVLDSTEPNVMEAGLRHIGGRAILNSANLEDGYGEGSRFDRVMSLAAEYGAAVICLLIDEEGQARDVEWKMRVAHRIHDLAAERYGMRAEDLIFDALTFPLSTGGDDLRGDALATIEAIRRIKNEIPGAFTVLGVSNVSFGLNPAARHALNSVFLHECVNAGLDAAIVHAGRIMPLSRLPEEQRQVCLDLVHDRRQPGYDPLQRLLEVFADVHATVREKEDRSGWPVNERLKHRIIDGDRDGLDDDLEAALSERTPALTIVNDVLLDGMKVVGELFATGEMQLPFVLQSAETMKAAVAYLTPHMERLEGETSKGRIVLATVKGDVHDIGKNLVDIILTNNGYEVHNLGIKCPIGDMVARAEAIKADAIGMSGLLVKSTLIMRDNLEELNSGGLAHYPVLLGGAALTRSYVERDLREVYEGRLFYGRDAFEGLRTMERLMELKRTGDEDPDFGRAPTGRVLPERRSTQRRHGGRRPGALARSRDRQPDPEAAVPRRAGGEGRVDRRDRERSSTRPRCSATSGSSVPSQARPTTRSRRACGRRFAPSSPPRRRPACSSRRWCTGTSPRTATATSSCCGPTRPGRLSSSASTSPASASSRTCASRTSSGRSSPARSTTPRSTSSRWAAPCRTRPRSSSATNRYQDYLLLHGMGVEMAEALAELWHRRIREEWGFADEDGPTVAGLFRQQYRGGRYSWGYPACPDLEDNAKVAELLGADAIGVAVSEESSWQYHPEQTTSAIICHHPRAKYFVAR